MLSVRSTSAAMPGKDVDLLRKASTATSLAALRMVGAAPPAFRAFFASRRAGETGLVRFVEREIASGGEVEPLEIGLETGRPRQAVSDRGPHVGKARLSDDGAVAVIDKRVDDGLGMDDCRKLIGFHVE